MKVFKYIILSLLPFIIVILITRLLNGSNPSFSIKHFALTIENFTPFDKFKELVYYFQDAIDKVYTTISNFTWEDNNSFIENIAGILINTFDLLWNLLYLPFQLLFQGLVLLFEELIEIVDFIIELIVNVLYLPPTHENELGKFVPIL